MSPYITETIGMVAGGCIASSFLPQNFRIIKTKDTSAISLTMYSIYVLGCLLWILYGFSVGSVAIIFWNTVTAVLAISILTLKVRYG